MKKIKKLIWKLNFICCILTIIISNLFSSVKILDDFNEISIWKPTNSDGVVMNMMTTTEDKSTYLGLDIDFTNKMGYVVITKDVSLKLPENFKITFNIKGEIPDNNVEFKLIDKEGNVFWKKWTNYKFQDQWTKMIVRKRDITFAWGPNPNEKLSKIEKIELAISCGTGGKGKVFFDELKIEEIKDNFLQIKNIKATSSSIEKLELGPQNVVDGDKHTRWSSEHSDNQWLILDLGEEIEISGLVIDWEYAYAKEYEILFSKDNINWTKVYFVDDSDGGTDEIFLKRNKVKYIKINCIKRGTVWGFSIYEIRLKSPDDEIIVSASTSVNKKIVDNLFDGNKKTYWHSDKNENQWLKIDFRKPREYSGIFIHWHPNDYAIEYDVFASTDAQNWTKIYRVKNSDGGRDRIYVEDGESRYLKIELKKSSGQKGYGISEIEIKGVEEKVTPIKKFEIAAEDSLKGFYPKYLQNKQSYWTVVGIDSDVKESLVNEEGALEVDKESFTIEPFLYLNNKLITWADVKLEQDLEKKYLPIPLVKWDHNDFTLIAKFFPSGEINNSEIIAWYKIKNNLNTKLDGKLFLAIRPFQVNPPWQLLNTTGGLAKVSSISYDDKIVTVNNEKYIIPLTKPTNFGAAEYASGDITKYLKEGKVPPNKIINDLSSYASAALEYILEIEPNEEKDIFILIPLYDSKLKNIAYESNMTYDQAVLLGTEKFNKSVNYWDSKLSYFEINLPPEDLKLARTIRSNLAYILINKDGPRIQPGSRSYNRSWIRDGSLTSSALLKMGLTKEVREFIDWYAKYIFPNGHVPCAVDDRGAEHVPENDSHGQYIYLCMQYYNYTKDKFFLKQHLSNIIKVADYIISLRNKRKSTEYKNGPIEKRILYGLVPESISHEGYSEKPMHSYWDNFFALKGLKDATKIMEILGERDLKNKYAREVLDYRKDLYESIKLAMQTHGISYIPGCAELGDFDATSISIGIYPVDEFDYMPRKELENTLNIYYKDVEKRILGKNWGENFTPYEHRNLRSFIYLNQKEKAHKILDYFFSCQRPYNWNHWAEIVWRIEDAPYFIGDMPHTWVGSDYINSVRSFFVIENENNGNITLCKGLKDEWLEYKYGVSVKNLPTVWGILNYELKKIDNVVKARIYGNFKQPGDIILFSPISKPIKEVKINGKQWKNFSSTEIKFKKIPVEVEITY